MKVLLPLDVMHPYTSQLLRLSGLLPLKEVDMFLLYAAENSKHHESILKKLGKSASELDEAVKAKAQKILEEASEELRPLCNTIFLQVLAGTPAHMISLAAKNEKCDLIVINSTDNGSADSYLLGSTASNVVKDTSIPVLVLKPTASSPSDIKRVLIGIDGSPSSLSAIKTFAKQFQAVNRKIEVFLVHVVSISGIWRFVSPIEFIAAVEDNLDMAAQVILAEAAKVLADVGLKPTDLIVRSGDPAVELMKTAQDLKADLIVVGAQGITASEHFLLGSVSNKLSLQSQLPTLIVR